MLLDTTTASSFVLVVDDDHDIRETMEVALELGGFRVQAVANGAEALAFLRCAGRRPDVIVLDLMMPVMNGYEFREEQLRDPDLADIPVLVLTGFGDAPNEASKLGAAQGLDKPLSLRALEAAIRRLGRCGEGLSN